MPDFDEIKQKLNDRMKSTPPVRLIVVSFFSADYRWHVTFGTARFTQGRIGIAA